MLVMFLRLGKRTDPIKTVRGGWKYWRHFLKKWDLSSHLNPFQEAAWRVNTTHHHRVARDGPLSNQCGSTRNLDTCHPESSILVLRVSTQVSAPVNKQSVSCFTWSQVETNQQLKWQMLRCYIPPPSVFCSNCANCHGKLFQMSLIRILSPILRY